jgi:hypothetical protein
MAPGLELTQHNLRSRSSRRRRRSRQSRVLRRLVPLLVLVVVAVVVGVGVLGGADNPERTLAQTYVRALGRGNFGAMYRLLSPASRRQVSLRRFAAAYTHDAATATVTELHGTGPVTLGGGRARELIVMRTRVFGTLREYLTLPFSPDCQHIVYHPWMAFPGLRPGERLRRTSTLGPRGALLAADGTPLAEGPDRTSPIPAVAAEVVGNLGPIPPSLASIYRSLGYPADAQVGLNGLELAFQPQLAGTPGGSLLAGRRVLASVAPRPGATIRTTIEPALEQAAIAALGGAYAGITVMNPRTGAIEAAAGLAWNDVQPPGSTFKIITASAALTAGLTTPTTVYPDASSADIGGYNLQNAGGEVCGGTLTNAFAVSCNSTFAPLGVRLGAARLVDMAVRFGFDTPPPFDGALESTIPSAQAIGGPTAVGSSAIGQGQVQASTLEMADVGATIANGGRRPLPTLNATAPPHYVDVVSARVAAEVQGMMVAVVRYGTGVTAAIPGVTVAGKTGTAELSDTANQQNNTKATDAWFVGYAPVGDPRVVASALFPNSGYGEATAGPAVRAVIEAALSAHGG